MNWSDQVIYVHGPGSEPYIRMFLTQGLRGTNDPDKASIICFTGGEDVNPKLYGEENVASYINEARDDLDAMFHGMACANQQLQVGICRGGQFLNVMNGGRMWQDVDNHAVRVGHRMTDLETGTNLLVSSTHHQMMRPAADGHIIATARESRRKNAYGDVWLLDDKEAVEQRPEDFDDVEVVWYEATRCLCFQPHPELPGFKACTDYFFKLIEKALQ